MKYIIDTNDQGQFITGSQVPYTPQAPQIVTQYFDWGIMGWVIGGVALVAVIFAWFVFLYPRWRVWASHKRGQADLAQAQNEQQIQISKAQSRKGAAELNKEAAIIEAEAVSQQVEKIGKNLVDHPLFLKWQWIKMMEERPEGSTIYVPTEANLPIMEATRFIPKNPKQSQE